MKNSHQAEAAYRVYAETEPIDNEELWHCYKALRESISSLPKNDQSIILERAAALANVQEKAAFLAGWNYTHKRAEECNE